MRPYQARVFCAVITATALAAPACAAGSNGATEGGGSTNADEIIIGASVAKTGGQTFYGGPAMVAAQEAIRDINENGGVQGKQLRLVWEDSQTDFAKSAAAAENVIDQGAQVVLVDCDFDYGLPAAQVAQKHGLVAMNLCAGSPRSGDPRILPMGFSMGVGTNVEAAAIAQYASETLGYQNVYLLRDDSIEYSKSFCGYFKEAWTNLGGRVAGESSFNNADASLQAQVSEIERARARYDAVTVCSYPPGLATAVRQLRAAGVDAPLLGSFTWDGEFWLGREGAGSLSDGYYPAYASIYGDDPRSGVNELFDVIRNEMGNVPYTSFALPGYAAIEALAKGIEKAGTTDGKKLTAALESFAGEELLVGPVTYTQDRHIRMVGRVQLAIMRVQDGKQKFTVMIDPEHVPEP